MKTDLRAAQSSSLLVSTPVLALLGIGTLLSLRFGSSLMVGLFLFFLLIGLLARWWSAKAIQGVSIRMECSRPRLFPGQDATIRYEIENGKLLPLVWLELSQNGPERACLTPDEAFEAYFPPGQEKEGATPYFRQTFSFVGGWQTIQVDSTWRAKRRGIYVMDRLLARSGDCFGLAQNEHVLPAEQLPVLAVYPRQVEVDLSLFLSPQWDCSAGKHGWMEDNTILRGNREYQPGDNWKHINWRMAAREQGTPINLYEAIQPRKIHFILDGEAFCGKSTDYHELEHTLEILSSIISGLSTAGIDCSLSLPASKRFPAMTLSDADVNELLFYLAGYDCLAAPDAESAQMPASPVYLPSRFPRDVVPQTGSTFLITYSGSELPRSLLPQLDPGKTWVLCLQDFDAPRRAKLRCTALDALCKGGAAS